MIPSRTSRLALTLCGALLAMAAPADARTLAESLAVAYETNPVLLARRAETRITDENVAQALSGWRPSVQVTASAGRLRQDQNYGDGDESRNRTSASLSINQPLYTGGRVSSSVDRSEFEVLASRGRLVDAEQTVLFDAVSAHVAVVRDMEILDLAISNVDRHQQELDALRTLRSVGDVTRTDVVLAEARLSRAIAQRAQAEADLEVSRERYERVVGLKPIDLEAPAPAESLPESLEAATRLAVEQHPIVATTLANMRAARSQVQAAKAELAPRLDLVGEVDNRSNDSFSGQNRSEAELRLELRVPLYQAGRASSQARQAIERLTFNLQSVNDARRQVLEGSAAAWQRLQAAMRSSEALDDEVGAAEQAYQNLRTEFLQGQRSIIEVLDAQRDLTDAQIRLAGARARVLTTSYELRQTIGTLTAAALSLPVDLYMPEEHYEEVRDQWWGWSDPYTEGGMAADMVDVMTPSFGDDAPQADPPLEDMAK